MNSKSMAGALVLAIACAMPQAHAFEPDGCEQQRAQYPKNQWVEAHGLNLQTYLARPMEEIRSTLQTCLDAAHAADQTIQLARLRFRDR